MAVVAKIIAPETADRLAVSFSELTGAYSLSNLGGWGSPNPVIADNILSAVLNFTRLGETITYPINVYVPPSTIQNLSFPTIDTSQKLVIPYSLFGGAQGAKLPNDIWAIEYLVQTIDGKTIVVTIYAALIKGIACCISKLRQNVTVPKSVSCTCRGVCKCDWKEIKCIATLNALYDSICPLIECGKLSRAQEVIKYLQAYCDCNCKGCS